jgi:hypothetical protein
MIMENLMEWRLAGETEALTSMQELYVIVTQLVIQSTDTNHALFARGNLKALHCNHAVINTM